MKESPYCSFTHFTPLSSHHPLSFLLRNLRIDGAAAKGNTLEPVDVPFVVQPLTVLKWHNSDG